MEVQVNFKVINPEYSQEYADEYNGGKESESNWKYNWAVSYGLKDVQSVSTIDNNCLFLKVILKMVTHFHSTFQMCILSDVILQTVPTKILLFQNPF